MPRARDTRLRRGLNLRSIAPEVVSEIKAHATALGITPSEYVRRLTTYYADQLSARDAGDDDDISAYASWLKPAGLLPKVQP